MKKFCLMLALILPISVSAVSVDELAIKANQGNAEYQAELALSYVKDTYFQDLDKETQAKFIDLATKSAEQGNAKGQYILANIYREGLGVAIDLPKALDLYTKSANQGNPESQNMLGYFYREGIILKKIIKWQIIGLKNPPIKITKLLNIIWVSVI